MAGNTITVAIFHTPGNIALPLIVDIFPTNRGVPTTVTIQYVLMVSV